MLWFILDYFKQLQLLKFKHFLWHQPLKNSFMVSFLDHYVLFLKGKKKKGHIPRIKVWKTFQSESILLITSSAFLFLVSTRILQSSFAWFKALNNPYLVLTAHFHFKTTFFWLAASGQNMRWFLCPEMIIIGTSALCDIIQTVSRKNKKTEHLAAGLRIIDQLVIRNFNHV